MDNDKTDGEGQVCTEQTSRVEITTAERNHVETPAATDPETTATTETSTMAAPTSEAATVATTPTTPVVAAPTASEQCISGGTNNAAATTVPIAAEHIHATESTKWIPASALGITNRRMTGRGDRKIKE